MIMISAIIMMMRLQGQKMKKRLKKRVAIVIPAYNAGDTIIEVIKRAMNSTGMSASSHVSYVIVDDGSKDDTAKIVADFSKKNSRIDISVITHRHNLGYGAAQKTGYAEALRKKAEIVVLLHADGQYPPEKIPEIIAPIAEGECDISAGSRLLHGDLISQGMPIHKYLGNVILTKLLNMRFGLNLSSYHSGFRAYSADALRKIPLKTLPDYFHFDTLILLWSARLGFSICEIPIETRYGSEKSHLMPFRYGAEILKVIIRGY
jgi:glycosyltransferase involved in cell wall biosynthesis